VVQLKKKTIIFHDWPNYFDFYFARWQISVDNNAQIPDISMYNVLFFVDIYNHCGSRTILSNVVKVLIIYEVKVVSLQKKTTNASSNHTCIEAMHHPCPNSECKNFLWIFKNTT